jgi:hypothetical protein
LKALEEKGLLNRTRGGATPAIHRDIMERQHERIDEKNRIAKAAAELVHDGDVIMIEAGTTTSLIAKHLSGKRDVHIVTNSTLVFAYARLSPTLQITMTGGEFRRPTESLVGPLALDTIEKLNVRLAFVGTDGFSLERGMTTHLVEGRRSSGHEGPRPDDGARGGLLEIREGRLRERASPHQRWTSSSATRSWIPARCGNWRNPISKCGPSDGRGGTNGPCLIMPRQGKHG